MAGRLDVPAKQPHINTLGGTLGTFTGCQASEHARNLQPDDWSTAVHPAVGYQRGALHTSPGHVSELEAMK